MTAARGWRGLCLLNHWKRCSLGALSRVQTCPLWLGLGVSVKAVTYYEREVSSPTTRTLARVAAAFGVEPSELLDAASGKRAARKPGPASQLEQRIAALREMPRERQKVVLNVIDTFLRDAKAS